MCFRNDCNGLEDFACDLIQMLLLLPESDALCMHRFELQALAFSLKTSFCGSMNTIAVSSG